MTLILSGTDGLSDVDGSAATPAIRGTDANTGIFFPAADTIAFSEGGVEAMRLDSAGNMGLGVTPSAWRSATKALQIGSTAFVRGETGFTAIGSNVYTNSSNQNIYIATEFASSYAQFNGTHNWSTAPSGTAGNTVSFTTAMTLDASGNLGLGTSSPSSAGASYIGLDIRGSGGGSIRYGVASGFNMLTYALASTVDFLTSAAGDIRFFNKTSSGESMRITSGGDLLVGGTYGSGFQVYFANTDGVNSRSGAAAGSSRSLYTGWYSATSSTSGTLSFNVTTNGNVTNTNNSYGQISDVKLKENIVDATPKLQDLMQVRIVNYNLKAELGYESHKQIGVVAQELEQVFAGLVDEMPDKDAEGNDLGTTTKSVKMSVFTPILIKAIQELKAIVDAQAVEIAALKGTP